MLKFKLWKAVACLAVLVAGAGRGEAASYKLSDLIAGGTFQSGDKVFSNFRNFTETGSAPAVGSANMYLTPISQANRDLANPSLRPFPLCDTPCPLEEGFRFSADIDITGAVNYNVGFDYDVTALGCEMYAAELKLTGNATNGQLDASSSVSDGTNTLAVLGTYIHNPETIANRIVDRHYFGFPTASICVPFVEASFGLQLSSTLVSGSVSFEHADVFFAQAIPEPSTYALLMLGSAGVGLMVRRKRA